SHGRREAEAKEHHRPREHPEDAGRAPQGLRGGLPELRRPAHHGLRDGVHQESPNPGSHRQVPALKHLALVVMLAGVPGCKKKVTPAQCEAIVDRYAELVVKEKMPDASAETIAAEGT